MELVSINFIAVLLAAVSNMVIGFFWYSPMLFGKQWMALMGIKEKDMGKMQEEAKNGYVLTFVAALAMAYVMAHFVGNLGLSTMGEAVQLGFWVWLGFIGATHVSDHVWIGKSMQLLYLNSGYRIVSTIVMALILTMWG